MDIQRDEAFEEAYSKICKPIIARPYPRNEKGEYFYKEIHEAHLMWQAAQAQTVSEGFVLVPTKNVKFFSHDGENYEVHDTLSGAKHEAKCAIQHYEDMLADQTTDPRSDGNFSQVGYGIVLAESGYSIDHVVTQKDVDKGDYSYEVGTEIMSLFLVEAQEQSHD
ncbi:hypothetical protein SAMN05444586_101547 [Acinetobacter bohemicus]|uniref:Uncharacterized protein n=2 Tax=Acinetobacter bohemicus TaxID=1435036 RepID=A0A1I6UAP7_9GAMM|nr:hypothetical protein SAMN05444586_101547 [Acinetobacter bohemicus]